MENLCVINNGDIKNKLKTFEEENKISEDEIICSLVYEFAKKLPYSIDYMDKDFVPGLFLNVAPINPTKWIFKDYNSLYEKMVNWQDTKKSGTLLQVCNIFQAMLMGQIPGNYQLTEEDFHNLGINQATNNEEYNRFLFETLQMLPQYCMRLNSMNSTEERRKMLDGIYLLMTDRIGQKIGGYKKTSIDSDIISTEEHKATVGLLPHKDLDMLYYFENINLSPNIRTLIDSINQKNVTGTSTDNESICLESEETKRK